MSFMFSSAVHSSVVLLIGLCCLPLLRRKSAALRHCVLATAVVFAALAPLFNLVTPFWNTGDMVTALPAVAPIRAEISAIWTEPPASPAIAASLGGPAESPEFYRRSLWVVWIAGVLFGAFVLVVGLGGVIRIARGSRPLADRQWVRLAGSISREYGLKRSVQLLESRSPSILVTFGGVRPKVILPEGAGKWPEDRARIVLRHELAHIRRGDWMTLMIAQALRAVYWFNPLVWIVCRRLRLEAECACDDAVLSRDINGPEYAGHLLELARALNRPGRAWAAALSMARPSTIERRFSAMLNPSVNRQPIHRFALYASVLAGFCVAVPVSVVTSAAPAGLPPVSATPALVESAQAPAVARPPQAPPPVPPPKPTPSAQAPATTAPGAKPVEDDPLVVALVEAAQEGHVAVVRVLLDRGANPNVIVSGQTALMEAASEGKIDVVRLLLERGANPLLVVDGSTALSEAAGEGHAEVVELLLTKIPPRPAK